MGENKAWDCQTEKSRQRDVTGHKAARVPHQHLLCNKLMKYWLKDTKPQLGLGKSLVFYSEQLLMLSCLKEAQPIP